MQHIISNKNQVKSACPDKPYKNMHLSKFDKNMEIELSTCMEAAMFWGKWNGRNGM